MSEELYYKCSLRILHNNLLETYLSRSHLFARSTRLNSPVLNDTQAKS